MSPAFARALVALWFLAALATLGLAPLFDYDETVYAQTALDMMRHHAWLTPEANGMPFHEKPAVIYYLMDASFLVFGPSAFAARLPSTLMTLATALLLARAGRRLGDAAMGWMAAAIFLTMLETGLLGRAAILDPTLNLCIAGALLYYLVWKRGGKPGDMALAAAFAGLAVSVKGPVGVVVPLMVAGLDRLLDKQPRPWRDIPWRMVIPAFLITAVPWYAAQVLTHSWSFLRDFIWVHNIQRAMHPMQGHGGRWFYYLPVFAISVIPWLAWLPRAARDGWQQLRASRAEGAPADLPRLCLVWMASVIALFSLAQTKLPHYISSVYPATALLLAWSARKAATSGRAAMLFTAALVALPGLALFSLPWIWPHLPAFVHHPRALAIVTQPLSPGWPVALTGGALVAAALVAARLPSRRALSGAAALGLAMQLAFFTAPGMFAGRLIQGPAARIADEARRLPPDAPLLSLHLNAPSVSFGAGRNFRMAQADEIARLAAAGQRFAVFLRAEHRAELARAVSLPAPRVNQGGYLLYVFEGKR